ncbi:LacI family DNA-binding transcriptional regulator [Treponema primitia]|uniref:LacI family DNA-binding transcriptional regulator n=1 Tax=Treponema primitia TaxID=88058 RepID=UPI00025555CC|nr:LacI family DNA-binding transcriptional regulator [Treponema primitia]
MKPMTIADIAREAGVSKATVSRVLSKSSLVHERTRKKVSSIIDKYGYTPNILAQGLAGMPTKTIGVVVDEFPNNFYIDLADGIDSVISVNDYFFQVMSSHWIPERELQGVRSLINNRVDGILITPAASDSATVEALKKSGIPFVLMNCRSDDPEVSYVSCDNYKGGALMAEHINSLDHEQIILVSVFDHESVRDRIKGFDDHLRAGAVRTTRYSDAKTYQDGYVLAAQIAESDSIKTKKTSLFVTNDYVAIGFITRFLEMGIAIPEQAAVAGFDDIRLSALCQVPLTTVSQQVFTMGRTAAEDLMNIIKKNGTPPFRRTLDPHLIIRKSTGK